MTIAPVADDDPCRVMAFDIDTSGFTEVERRSVVAHRWWTLDELHRATERLVPDDLAIRLADLLTDGPPPTPIDIA